MAAQRREPIFSANIHDDPLCTWEECKSAGLRSIAAIPLMAGDEAIGVVCLGSSRQRDFAMEADFLHSLVHEITMGVKNSLLFEQIQEHARDLEESLAKLRRSNEERDHLHSQLLQAQKMEAIGILSGGIAHDFNNILQIIHGYVDLAMFRISSEGTCHKHLREIKKAAQRAAELTQGLLTFSRRITGKLMPVDVNREIQHVVAMLSHAIPKMIGIRIDLEEGIRMVKGDPSQLQQVLMNLAINARDAMPHGGTLLIETRNLELHEDYCRRHLGTAPGHHVLISVSDTGLGMDTKTKGQIFDPFFTTKEVGKGTGLGLSIVYGIVQSHGGQILCYSESGEGATFKIYLPAMVEEGVMSRAPLELEAPKGGTETVLIVDDEETIRDVATEVLTNFGYKVLTAANGKEALCTYQEKTNEIDLVILDLMMPEMGGRQCAELIFATNPSAKIIIASGYSSNGQLDEVRQIAPVTTITKPFDARQLLKLVREMLDSE